MNELLTWEGEALDGCIVSEDLSGLRSFMTRGSNRTFPGANGTRPLAPVLDELDTTLRFFVSGRFAPDGTPHADRQTGVEQNLEHYRTLFTTGADPDTGEHDIALDYAGTTYVGTAQVRDYAAVRTGDTTATILLRLVVPAGELSEDSS